MVDRYIMKTVLVAMAVVFMLTIDVPRASAAGCVAKTCTEAFSFCMNTGCRQTGTPGQNCFPNCNAWRDTCMQSGEFPGWSHQCHGLVKK